MKFFLVGFSFRNMPDGDRRIGKVSGFGKRFEFCLQFLGSQPSEHRNLLSPGKSEQFLTAQFAQIRPKFRLPADPVPRRKVP